MLQAQSSSSQQPRRGQRRSSPTARAIKPPAAAPGAKPAAPGASRRPGPPSPLPLTLLPPTSSGTHQREEVGVAVLQAGPVRHPVGRCSHDPRRAPARGMSGERGPAAGGGCGRCRPLPAAPGALLCRRAGGGAQAAPAGARSGGGRSAGGGDGGRPSRGPPGRLSATEEEEEKEGGDWGGPGPFFRVQRRPPRPRRGSGLLPPSGGGPCGAGEGRGQWRRRAGGAVRSPCPSPPRPAAPRCCRRWRWVDGVFLLLLLLPPPLPPPPPPCLRSVRVSRC